MEIFDLKRIRDGLANEGKKTVQRQGELGEIEEKTQNEKCKNANNL
jgi:hypothetical protein